MNLEDLRATFRKHLYLPDPAVVDFTAAVIIANRLDGDGVWGMVVGAPGSGKTEVVQAALGVPEAYPIGTLTESTLLSGKGKEEDGDYADENDRKRSPSLLHRLSANKKSLLVMKDFGSILSMRADSRAQVLASLREVYDGNYQKDFGTGRVAKWRGKMGLLAGVTPVIDVHHSVLAVLGERFIYLRLPAVDDKIITEAAFDEDEEKKMRREFLDAMADFTKGISGEVPEVTPEVREALVSIARRTAWLRSAVHRDGYSHEILMSPSRETPTRLVKQLRQLWRAATMIGVEDPIGFVDRVAKDSSPGDRRNAFNFIVQRGQVTSTEIRKHTGLPYITNNRLLEDLVALRMVYVAIEGGGTVPHTYSPTADVLALNAPKSAPILVSPRNLGEGERGEIIDGDKWFLGIGSKKARQLIGPVSATETLIHAAMRFGEDLREDSWLYQDLERRSRKSYPNYEKVPDALVDRIVAWAEEDVPPVGMAELAQIEDFRRPNNSPWQVEELWDVVAA